MIAAPSLIVKSKRRPRFVKLTPVYPGIDLIKWPVIDTNLGTNCRMEDICDHILITNFKKYILRFQEQTKAKYSKGNFRIANAKDINCTMTKT